MGSVPIAVIVAAAILQCFAYFLGFHARSLASERFTPRMRGFEQVAVVSLLAERAFLLGFGIFFWSQFGFVELLALAVISLLLSFLIQIATVHVLTRLLNVSSAMTILGAISLSVMPVAAIVMVGASAS